MPVESATVMTDSTQHFECAAIGVVRNGVTEMSQGRWGDVESEIHLNREYERGLDGLDAFSHIVVVFYLHGMGAFDIERQLLRHPRGMERLSKVGVFAQRTKYRPNPIGVTSVELRALRGNVAVVRGLDALDGTPVLDLKPYIPMFDRVKHARTPDWVAHFMEGYM